MHERKIKVEGLLEKYENALGEYGFGFATRLSLLKRAAIIIHLHEKNGKAYLEHKIIAEYNREISERFNNGLITSKTHGLYLREIERLVTFATSNSLAFHKAETGCRQVLEGKYERIAGEFIKTIAHANTRDDARWVSHKYFSWLAEQGILDIRTAGATEIQKFLLYCSKTMAMNSIRNVRLYLKKLYAYLYEKGLAESPFQELLSFKVKNESKIYPFLPRADIAKMLDSINRNTTYGKRDHAIMMLGTVLGLRACDVIALKLSDIDWQRSEIRFVQNKTGKTAVLPLTQDVGDALEDYILGARPKTEVPQIFLTQSVPRTAIRSASTVGEIFERCCKKAGLSESKRFHDLRRSLATSMSMNGVSVYDIADGLADSEIDSLKPYIASDTKHLKMCALPLCGISKVAGGVS